MCRLVLLVVSAVHASFDACHFIGARFAHTVSTCMGGVCFGVFLSDSGHLTLSSTDASPVACSLAETFVSEFLSEANNDGLTTSDLPELMESALTALAGSLTAGSSVAIDALHANLSLVERRARTLAATDPIAWHATVAPQLLASPQLLRLGWRIRIVVGTIVERPLTLRPVREPLQAVVFFYFDFAALLGYHFLPLKMVHLGCLAVQSATPHYREVHRWEHVLSSESRGALTSSSTVVALSEAIESIAEPDCDLTSTDLSVMINVLLGWTMGPPSATKSLIHGQIITMICPRLPDVMERIASDARFREAGIMISTCLLDLCRAWISDHRSTDAHDLIDKYMREHVQPLLYPSDLSSDHIPPNRNHASFSELPSNNANAQNRLSDFISANVTWVVKAGFRVPQFVGDTMEESRRLGRALGFAIMQGVDLDSLRMPPYLVALLHPRFRHLVGDSASVRSKIAPMSSGELLMLHRGLDDGLGPGGFEMLRDEQWMKLFGVSF